MNCHMPAHHYGLLKTIARHQFESIDFKPSDEAYLLGLCHHRPKPSSGLRPAFNAVVRPTVDATHSTRRDSPPSPPPSCIYFSGGRRQSDCGPNRACDGWRKPPRGIGIDWMETVSVARDSNRTRTTRVCDRARKSMKVAARANEPFANRIRTHPPATEEAY